MSKMKWMMMVRYVEPGGNSDKYSFVVATDECGTQVGISFFYLCHSFFVFNIRQLSLTIFFVFCLWYSSFDCQIIGNIFV